MVKKKCEECPREANSLIPICKLEGGVILYVCKQCYMNFDYNKYLHAPDCGCDHCESQKEAK